LHSSKEGFRLVLVPPKRVGTFKVSSVEKTKESYFRTVAVISTGDQEIIRARIRFDSKEEKEVSLSQGDIPLFRSDVHVKEVYYTEYEASSV
jgi:hypothetical protein